MGTNKFFKRTFISLPIVIIIIFSLSAVPAAAQEVLNKPPVVRNGILDFSGWDSKKDGILDLSGEWDFYWNELLTYKDLKDDDTEPDLKANVPIVWNAYQIDGKSLPGYGCATYRIRVINVIPDTPITLQMPTMSTAYRVFIDNEMIASNGKVASGNSYYSTPGIPIQYYCAGFQLYLRPGRNVVLDKNGFSRNNAGADEKCDLQGLVPAGKFFYNGTLLPEYFSLKARR